MGRNHCRVLSTLRHATLAGVTDRDQAVGAQVAGAYESTFYPTVDDLLDHVDAVVIATPTPSHYPLAMHCLAQGRHVLIEKPIAATIDEAAALTVAAEKSGLVVQVGHIERFNPTYTELKHVLDDIHVAAVNFRRLSPYVGSNTDVDVVLDLMIHDLDLVLDLMQQPPVALHAVGMTAYSGDIDHAVAQLTFPAGPLLTVMVSRLTEHKVRAIDVTGLEAYIEGDLLNKSILLHRSTTGEYLNNQHSVKYRQESTIERLHVPIAEPLLLELQHFVEAIREGRAPVVSARDGLRALQLAHEIRRLIHQQLVLIQRPQPPCAGAVAVPSAWPAPTVHPSR
jgi:predicted dehydrogenase